MTEKKALSSKEDLLKRFEENKRPISLNNLGDILDSTIKHDVENKIICFLSMILNYTSEDQVNIGFNAESSTGKSYLPLELAKYFPPIDLRIQGYTSPTAFFHEWGDWDEEKKVKTIDLKQKILIFVDQPHDMLLQRLRPLLSHDKRYIVHKITDRSKTHGLSTKSIQIRGYPTVIFCTTKFSLDDQERTRLLLLSPEVDQEKIRDSLELLTNKLSNRNLFKQWLEENPRRQFLKTRVSHIKDARIQEIIISQEDRDEILQRFLMDHQFLIPRHQRDYPRLVAMIKAHALLNLYQREIIEIDGDKMLVVDQEDIEAGYELYKGISRSNELGIPPEVLTIYEKVIIPELEEPRLIEKFDGKATIEIDKSGIVSKKDLSKKYYSVFHKTIGKKRLNKILDALLETGLIIEDKDPNDKRVVVYSHPQGYISQDLEEPLKQPHLPDKLYTPRGVSNPEHRGDPDV